jgi:hypothetical protein
MDEIKKIINKKLNQLGIRKKIDELAICKHTAEFFNQFLKNIKPREISFYNRILMIK